jgi:ketosteroid isomerase-like protein
VPTLRTLLSGALCAAALAAGCGGDDERDVRETLRNYVTAMQQRDYQALCDEVLSEKLVENLRQATTAPCETALKGVLDEVERPTIEVRSVTIDGDTASAVARTDAANQDPSEDTIRLAKEDGRWKIFALSSAPS